MAEKTVYKTNIQMVDQLANIEYRLNGLAAIIEERAYGLNELGISPDGYDMDADNLIVSIIRNEAEKIKRLYEGLEPIKRGESRE